MLPPPPLFSHFLSQIVLPHRSPAPLTAASIALHLNHMDQVHKSPSGPNLHVHFKEPTVIPHTAHRSGPQLERTASGVSVGQGASPLAPHSLPSRFGSPVTMVQQAQGQPPRHSGHFQHLVQHVQAQPPRLSGQFQHLPLPTVIMAGGAPHGSALLQPRPRSRRPSGGSEVSVKSHVSHISHVSHVSHASHASHLPVVVMGPVPLPPHMIPLPGPIAAPGLGLAMGGQLPRSRTAARAAVPDTAAGRVAGDLLDLAFDRAVQQAAASRGKVLGRLPTPRVIWVKGIVKPISRCRYTYLFYKSCIAPQFSFCLQTSNCRISRGA